MFLYIILLINYFVINRIIIESSTNTISSIQASFVMNIANRWDETFRNIKNKTLNNINIDEKTFITIIQDTSSECCNNTYPDTYTEGNNVIKNIYAGALELEYTIEQIIQFLSTAMHNHNCFQSIVSRYDQTVSTDVSYGLIQFTGPGHEVIKKYLKSEVPINNLDLFTIETITAEMKCFSQEYFNKKKIDDNGLMFYIGTIQNLAPNDIEFLYQITTPENTLNTIDVNQAFQRRINLYTLLYKNIYEYVNKSINSIDNNAIITQSQLINDVAC